MNPQGHQGAHAGHERKDVDVPGVVFVAGFVLLLIAISFFIVWGLLRFFFQNERNAHVTARRSTAEQSEFPQPRLQVDPVADRKASRAENDLKLHSYGWVNRSAGVARIPVERAMQLLVERGLPEVGAGQTRLQLMQARPSTEPQPNEPVVSPRPEGSPR